MLIKVSRSSLLIIAVAVALLMYFVDMRPACDVASVLTSPGCTMDEKLALVAQCQATQHTEYAMALSLASCLHKVDRTRERQLLCETLSRSFVCCEDWLERPLALSMLARLEFEEHEIAKASAFIAEAATEMPDKHDADSIIDSLSKDCEHPGEFSAMASKAVSECSSFCRKLIWQSHSCGTARCDDCSSQALVPRGDEIEQATFDWRNGVIVTHRHGRTVLEPPCVWWSVTGVTLDRKSRTLYLLSNTGFGTNLYCRNFLKDEKWTECAFLGAQNLHHATGLCVMPDGTLSTLAIQTDKICSLVSLSPDGTIRSAKPLHGFRATLSEAPISRARMRVASPRIFVEIGDPELRGRCFVIHTATEQEGRF